MTAIHRLCLAGSIVLGLGLSDGALAQSTDGYHSIQIFPVVVDTASFTQRFNFRNPNDASVTITPKYYPASGTTAAITTCPDIVIAAGKTATFTSLRQVCPSLAAGSQFGFLYTSELSPSSLPYAGFSRVANPQGNGFTVEAFPAHTFTSADSVINGLRRKAAGPSNPAFQTNCFMGNLNEVTASPSPSTTQGSHCEGARPASWASAWSRCQAVARACWRYIWTVSASTPAKCSFSSNGT